MISFISGTLLKDNLRKFQAFASSEIQHTQTWYCLTMFDLNNSMSVPNMEFFQIKIFVLLDKTCKTYKVV